MSVYGHIHVHVYTMETRISPTCTCTGSFQVTLDPYLEHDFDDSSDYGQLGKINGAKHFDPLVEQLLDVAEQTAIHSTANKNTES